MDPLSEKNHFSSPYVDNNPVLRIDPDGKDWIINMKEEDGKTVFDITLNGKVYNNSSGSYTKDQLIKFRDQIAYQIRSAFGQDNSEFKVHISVDVEVANKLDDIKKTDHVFQIVDDAVIAGTNGAWAAAEVNGLNVRIAKSLAEDIINTGENTRTVPHELGHTGGLDHPHGATLGSENPDPIGYADIAPSQRGQNLMSQTWYILQSGNPLGNARKITKDQYEYLYHQYKNGDLNQNSPVKTKWIFTTAGTPVPRLVNVKYLENTPL